MCPCRHICNLGTVLQAAVMASGMIGIDGPTSVSASAFPRARIDSPKCCAGLIISDTREHVVVGNSAGSVALNRPWPIQSAIYFLVEWLSHVSGHESGCVGLSRGQRDGLERCDANRTGPCHNRDRVLSDNDRIAAVFSMGAVGLARR
jgi:hypothetical protein